MPNGINTVTVIGAGTMGAAIAGHLANAGVPVTLLDMVPRELTPQEEAAGLSLDDRRVRNRIVQDGFDRMIKAKPNNLFVKDAARLISVGNLEDDFEAAVGKSDWIIEVIIERPEPKQALMARIEEHAPAGAVISTNTSGIPIHIISEGRSESFKQRFLGTHFFNPPRYLHLLEIIPTQETDPAVVERMKRFGEDVLGKGVVVCKDTPNFVANRMISFIQSDVMEFAIENGYTVEEVDRLTGPLLGRPKTGTFRLNDVIGIDVMALVSQNLYQMIPDDEDREILRGEYGSAIMEALIENKLLGSKVGQGFYKTVKDEQGKKAFWGLDLQTAAEDGEIEYVEPRKPKWDSVGDAKDLSLVDRLQALVEADDAAGELIWHTLSRTMAYASKRIPEIADSIVDIDNAMKWGFAWEMGPFETWDVLGVEETVNRLAGEGVSVAPWVVEMLESGHEQFYTYYGTERMAYSPLTRQYEAVKAGANSLTIGDVKRSHAKIAGNESASLLDMGDGVMLLEFHSKMNALDDEMFEIAQVAIDRMYGDATGLVIANEGENFSVGANLLKVAILAQSGQWEEIGKLLQGGQDTLLALRKAPKPVVAAPFQRVLGGGVETCLASDRIVAAAETYMGLVEVGVGIIPGWGGCKEMVRRHVSPHMHATNVNPMPYLRKIFETIGFAKVSMSGEEARQLGYLAEDDLIVMNRDQQLSLARQAVLEMADEGYRPPVTTGNVYAAGRDHFASVKIETYSMIQGGFISEHDAFIAEKLGYVLTGGDLSEPAWMDEQYFLDLELDAVLTLASTPKTQDRVLHMLQRGKPLRN
ncbi:MAG: enoyl-CoA hydratase/isomerase family protein [Caldilineaceae bacterium]|nr:enoyl-CoA hydratase/isomerase family protein [Caldilineaceae bacterium]